jgi:hypothetical protein
MVRDERTRERERGRGRGRRRGSIKSRLFIRRIGGYKKFEL